MYCHTRFRCPLVIEAERQAAEEEKAAREAEKKALKKAEQAKKRAEKKAEREKQLAEEAAAKAANEAAALAKKEAAKAARKERQEKKKAVQKSNEVATKAMKKLQDYKAARAASQLELTDDIDQEILAKSSSSKKVADDEEEQQPNKAKVKGITSIKSVKALMKSARAFADATRGSRKATSLPASAELLRDSRVASKVEEINTLLLEIEELGLLSKRSSSPMRENIRESEEEPEDEKPEDVRMDAEDDIQLMAEAAEDEAPASTADAEHVASKKRKAASSSKRGPKRDKKIAKKTEVAQAIADEEETEDENEENVQMRVEDAGLVPQVEEEAGSSDLAASSSKRSMKRDTKKTAKKKEAAQVIKMPSAKKNNITRSSASSSSVAMKKSSKKVASAKRTEESFPDVEDNVDHGDNPTSSAQVACEKPKKPQSVGEMLAEASPPDVLNTAFIVEDDELDSFLEGVLSPRSIEMLSQRENTSSHPMKRKMCSPRKKSPLFGRKTISLLSSNETVNNVRATIAEQRNASKCSSLEKSSCSVVSSKVGVRAQNKKNQKMRSASAGAKSAIAVSQKSVKDNKSAPTQDGKSSQQLSGKSAKKSTTVSAKKNSKTVTLASGAQQKNGKSKCPTRKTGGKQAQAKKTATEKAPKAGAKSMKQKTKADAKTKSGSLSYRKKVVENGADTPPDSDIMDQDR